MTPRLSYSPWIYVFHLEYGKLNVDRNTDLALETSGPFVREAAVPPFVYEITKISDVYPPRPLPAGVGSGEDSIRSRLCSHANTSDIEKNLALRLPNPTVCLAVSLSLYSAIA